MRKSEFITRFAPSPTGYLHLGHAYAAYVAFGAAQAARGVCLLRIEDIDQSRRRPAFEDAIFEDLRWLGLDWPSPVRRQSDHFDAYASALESLTRAGLAYRCFKTRKEILADIARAPHGSDATSEPSYVGGPLAPSEERALLDAGAPFAWRLSMERARAHLGDAFDALTFIEERDDETIRVKARPERFGDVVIARKDAGTSYHLASVHDDALQAVTHVIRGEDLRAAADLHRLLQALMDLPTPVYRHHSLVKGADGKRLAKRDHSETIRARRDRGETPEQIRTELGF